MKKLFLFVLLFSSSLALAKINPQTVDAFIKSTASNNNLDEQSIRLIINQAKRQQSIIDAMNKPAEKSKQWFEYRAIFLKDKRIKQGVEFWDTHQKTLEAVNKASGVPIEIIVAIIGVETYYGGNKGSYRVIDALYTLAFDYPRRAKFFTKELEKFLVLVTKEKISALETKGSYAGAMGFGQFMPSSYLMYALDYDKDGQRDLLNNIPDAIASVANYLKVHGWKKDQGIAYLATARADFKKLNKQKLKPAFTVKQLNAMGYSTKQKLADDAMVTLTQLQQKDYQEYWFGMHNFYIITRYNHSEMYAMAVYQLAQEIKKMRESRIRLRN
ncbi:Membrane-bound lytic murein transglycosylase B [hydrothermal vent metagenome]|uniref:Membrane-bound lytic murein transglycosylase B n=1 Tax=hydrothermal vent metagenome TaxID=652676 RepID=A0A3B0USG8_9ZZZZ